MTDPSCTCSTLHRGLQSVSCSARSWVSCLAVLLVCGCLGRPCSAQSAAAEPAANDSASTAAPGLQDASLRATTPGPRARGGAAAGIAPAVGVRTRLARTGLSTRGSFPNASSPDASSPPDDPSARDEPAGDDEPKRANRWRQRREAKRQSMSPPSTSWLERTGSLLRRTQGKILGDQVLLDVPDIDLYGVRPVFGGLPSGSGVSAGLYYQPPFLAAPGRHVHAEALASIRSYYGGEAVYGSESGDYVRYAYARYNHMPRKEFYGVGPTNRKEAAAGYRLNEILAGGLLGRTLTDGLLLGTHLSYSANRFGPGSENGLPQASNRYGDVAGVGEDVDYVMVGSFVEYDSRDVPYDRGYGERFAPTEDRLRRLSLDAQDGFYVSSKLTHHVGVNSLRHSFTRLSVDVQQYFSIDEGTHHGFAFRQFVSFTHTTDDQQVPFYRLQSLGGSESLRGYTTGRFRDYNVMLVNAEVRCQVWHWLDMAVFGDAGHVFREFDDLGLRTIRGNGGLGFRLRTSDGTAARLDAAYGTEGLRVRLNLGSLL